MSVSVAAAAAISAATTSLVCIALVYCCAPYFFAPERRIVGNEHGCDDDDDIEVGRRDTAGAPIMSAPVVTFGHPNFVSNVSRPPIPVGGGRLDANAPQLLAHRPAAAPTLDRRRVLPNTARRTVSSEEQAHREALEVIAALQTRHTTPPRSPPPPPADAPRVIQSSPPPPSTSGSYVRTRANAHAFRPPTAAAAAAASGTRTFAPNTSSGSKIDRYTR